MMKSSLYCWQNIQRIWLPLFLGFVVVLGSSQISWSMDYQHGVDLFRDHHYKKAQKYALAAHKRDPENVQYTALLGWTWYKQGNYKKAEVLFRSILKKKPYDIGGIQGMAWVFYAKGDLSHAHTYFLKDISFAKKHQSSGNWLKKLVNNSSYDKKYVGSIMSDAYYGLGLIALSRHTYGTAESDFLVALKYPNTFTGYAPIKTSLANVYYAKKRYSAASRIYIKLLRNNPDNAQAIDGLVRSIRKSGRELGAKRILNSGERKAKDRRPYLLGIMLVSRLQNHKPAVQRAFLKLIHIDPEYISKVVITGSRDKVFWEKLAADNAKQLGESFFEHADFANALRFFKIHLSRSPKDPDVLMSAAYCKIYLGRHKEALSDFSRLAVQTNIPIDRALTGKGVALLYLGRLNEAEKVFHTVVRKYPENIRARVDLGDVAYLKGEYKKAIRIYRANLKYLPAKDAFFSWPSYALNYLGWSYYYTGDYAKALYSFKKLEKYHPHPIYPIIYVGEGWSYLKLHRKAKARWAFEKSLSLEPKNKSALKGLAVLAGK